MHLLYLIICGGFGCKESQFYNEIMWVASKGGYRVNNEEADKFNNIYDFLGNCYEWTTEYSSYEWPGHIYDVPYPYVYRGGSYSDSSSSASMRDRLSDDTGLDTDCSDIGFRIQLYVKK